MAPPSSVRRTTPRVAPVYGWHWPPTAQPRWASTKKTALSEQETGDGCWRQVAPASSVCQITPRSPTAQPVDWLMNERELSVASLRNARVMGVGCELLGDWGVRRLCGDCRAVRQSTKTKSDERQKRDMRLRRAACWL